jgi:VWFA-related protein
VRAPTACALVLMAGCAFAQTAPSNEPAPTFSAATKLVQVSVVPQDKQAKPVADLRREEFQVFDNGAPQEIRFFLAETEKSGLAAPPVTAAIDAPNTFSNRIAPAGGSHSGYSVILIDSLFTDAEPIEAEGTSSIARMRALRTLRSIAPNEKVAIYAQGRKLQIICEFTSDRDLLERQLLTWKPRVDTPGTTARSFSDELTSFERQQAARESALARTNPQLAQQLAHPRGDAAGEAERIDGLTRLASSDEEMNMVADHLAGIPGRKNLIWLTDKFAIGPRAIQKLNAAGVSIYPVDVDGVCTRCARSIGDPYKIAALTGGVAYTRRNDLETAIREAMDDGRISYTLGFYPSRDDDHISQVQPQFHQLTVSVTRPGVTLRYRTNYEVEPAHAASADPVADLVQALNRPVDATAIPIKASVTRGQDRLSVQALLDVENLDLAPPQLLAPRQLLWTGKIEVVARFATAYGIVASDVLHQTLTLNLRQGTYESALRDGFAWQYEFTIPAQAAELKVLFANPATGKIGTLTIPLSAVAAR